MSIEVSNCDYCWEPCIPYRICNYFSNEGGFPKCFLNLGLLKIDENCGVKKPVKCLSLINSKN